MNVSVLAAHMHTGLPYMAYGAPISPYGADVNFTHNTAHMAT